jgi:hypothetical protein
MAGAGQLEQVSKNAVQKKEYHWYSEDKFQF